MDGYSYFHNQLYFIGVNVFGPSSSGKTTCALVAGSVCGGGGRNGFIRSWRTTDNALEATAALHNDGLLILDELGQAVGDSVGRTIYMLINGEAKTRMTAEAKLRNTAQWRTNILSTGELTIPEKIGESGKYRSMAGQEVRVVDLPLLGVNGEQLFENFHGFESGAQLSKVLSEKSKDFFGAPLRAFLKALCINQEEYAERIFQYTTDFEKLNIPQNASGQVQRVGRKFALIAAIGALATELDIFPYEKNEAYGAASQWFKIWLDRRPGIGNLELEKCIQEIMNTIDLKGMVSFITLDPKWNYEANAYRVPYHLGYKWKEADNWVYFILFPEFTRLCKGTSRETVEQELLRRKLLKLNKNGKIMETKSIGGQNVRGIGILVPLVENDLVSPAFENSPTVSVAQEGTIF